MPDYDEMLSTMRNRLRMAQAAWSDTREDELQDLRFRAGSPDNNWQWPADVLSTRGSLQGQTINARPTLTINMIDPHVLQVTNEQRQNRPSGKVIPADDAADVEVAEVFDGIVRHIEYMSDADVAYDTACDNQVTHGEGYIRLLTEFCRDDSFDQDVKIGRVRNSFSVYMDPMIQDPCGADAKWCFITQDMTKEEYEREFPDAAPVSTLLSLGDESISDWIEQDTVRIAEYFYYDHKAAKLNLWPDNTTSQSGTNADKLRALQFGKPKRTRDLDLKVVKWIKTNGYETLSETDWPGQWIPVIRVLGNEYEVEGQIYLSGLVRNAKDAQRMYNYWASQEAEMLALAPKAPFIMYGGQQEGFEYQWKTANSNNWTALEINPDVTDALGNPLPLPQRSQPPMMQNGILQAKLGAADDIKKVTGQYDPALGADSQEKSGKAIMARQKQSDVGTYHYVDNLARAIRHITRQIVDIIPKIYDTKRIARIVGLDDEVDMVKIDPGQQQPVVTRKDQNGGVIEKIYNPSIGTYDVVVTTGPSYMTKRQEGLEALTTMVQAAPQLWGVIGDQIVRLMDMPYAQEMADRIKRTIDPKILGDDDKTPEVAALEQENQQLHDHLSQAMQILQKVEQSQEAMELRIKAYDAETKRITALAPTMDTEAMHEIAAGTVDAALSLGDPTKSGEPDGDEAPMTPQGAE